MSLDQSKCLLSRSPIVRTRDPEAMEHALLTVYGARGFSVSKADNFEGVGNYLQLANVGLGFCAYGGAKTIVDFPENDFARLQIALKGSAATILSGTALAIMSGNLAWFPRVTPSASCSNPAIASRGVYFRSSGSKTRRAPLSTATSTRMLKHGWVVPAGAYWGTQAISA